MPARGGGTAPWRAGRKTINKPSSPPIAPYPLQGGIHRKARRRIHKNLQQQSQQISQPERVYPLRKASHSPSFAMRSPGNPQTTPTGGKTEQMQDAYETAPQTPRRSGNLKPTVLASGRTRAARVYKLPNIQPVSPLDIFKEVTPNPLDSIDLPTTKQTRSVGIQTAEVTSYFTTSDRVIMSQMASDIEEMKSFTTCIWQHLQNEEIGPAASGLGGRALSSTATAASPVLNNLLPPVRSSAANNQIAAGTTNTAAAAESRVVLTEPDPSFSTLASILSESFL